MKKHMLKFVLGIFLVPLTSFATQKQYGEQNKWYQANPFPEGFYIGANAGYVSNDWEKNASPVGGRSAVTVSGPDWTNGRGAVTAGGCMGYQINQGLGVEVGGFWFNSIRLKHTLLVLGNNVVTDMRIKDQYAVFGAFTVQTPVGPFYLNAKVGGGYQHLNVQGSPVASPFFGGFKSAGHFGPMFGAALIYPYKHWSITARYDRFAGKNDHVKSKYIMDTNLITGQLAYHF